MSPPWVDKETLDSADQSALQRTAGPLIQGVRDLVSQSQQPTPPSPLDFEGLKTKLLSSWTDPATASGGASSTALSASSGSESSTPTSETSGPPSSHGNSTLDAPSSPKGGNGLAASPFDLPAHAKALLAMWTTPHQDTSGVEPGSTPPGSAVSSAPAGSGAVPPAGAQPSAMPSTGPDIGAQALSATNTTSQVIAHATAPTGGEIDNSSRAAFVKTAYPYMLQAAGGNKDAAEMMLAAAISENGDVGKGSGFVGNNFFGIKSAGAAGTGAVGAQSLPTWEQENGQHVNKNQDFAIYADPVSGFGAFMKFLQTNPRYSDAVSNFQKTGSASQLFRDINDAGYASDPVWASKVANIRDNQVAPITRGLDASQPVAQAQNTGGPPWSSQTSSMSASDTQSGAMSTAPALTTTTQPSNDSMPTSSPDLMLRQPLGMATSGPDNTSSPSVADSSLTPMESWNTSSAAPSVGMTPTWQDSQTEAASPPSTPSAPLDPSARNTDATASAYAPSPPTDASASGATDTSAPAPAPASSGAGAFQDDQTQSGWVQPDMAPGPPVPDMSGTTPPARFNPLAGQQPEPKPSSPTYGQQVMGNITGTLRSAGEAGSILADQIEAATHGGTIDPQAILNAVNALPYDIYSRARREAIPDAEAVSTQGTDPLFPLRGTGLPLPSAEEVNPQGRPSGDVIGGALAQAASPGQEFQAPLQSAGFHLAGEGLGLLGRGLDAAAPAIGRGIQAARRGAEDIGTGLRENAGRVAALDAERAGQGSTVAASALGTVPEAPIYGPTPPEGYVRRYHGTSADFPSVDTGTLNERSLWGPGYYMTDDPRVAGGIVDDSGRVTSPGYAQERGLTPAGESKVAALANQRQYVATDLQRAQDSLQRVIDANPAFPDGQQVLSARRNFEPQIQRLQAKLDDLDKRLGTSAGPNVRALDVPTDLNLLDTSQPALPDVVDQVGGLVEKVWPKDRQFGQWLADNVLTPLEQAEKQGPISGETLATTVRDAANEIREPALIPEILKRLGYDGITHPGGLIRPMYDETGQAINHTATVIFPDSVGKIRNATAGTYGGAAVGTVPDFPGAASRGKGFFDRATPILGQGTASAVSGGIGAATAQQLGDPNDPNRAAKGFIAGALIPPLAARGFGAMARRLNRAAPDVEGALSMLGNTPPTRRLAQEAEAARLREAGAVPSEQPSAAQPRLLADDPLQRGPGMPGEAPRGPDATGVQPEAHPLRTSGQLPMEGMPNDPMQQGMTGIAPAGAPRLPAAIERAQTLAARQAQAAERAGRPAPPSAWDWVKAAGYSGIYSPATLVASGIEGAQELALAQPKEAIRALVQGRPGAYAAQARAQIGAVSEGITNLGRVLMGNASEAAAVSGGSRGTAGLSDRVTSPGAHFAARILERPGEILTEAPDAVFRPVFEAQGMSREAWQVASEMGLGSRQQAATYADNLLKDAQAVRNGALPTLPQTQQVLDAGQKYADQLGFKGKPGEIGQYLGRLSKRDDALGVLASFLIPFPSMASRMSGAALKSTPGAAFIPGVRRMYPSKFDMVYDQAFGTLAATGVGYWAMNGGITGSGPDDSTKRNEMIAQGWQPNSTLVGGYYIPNRMLGRFEPMLNTAGELHDALAYGTPNRPAPQIAADLVKRGSTIATDQIGLSGLADLHDMLSSGFSSQFPGWAARSMTRYLPYGGALRAAAASLDPVQRRADKWTQGSPLPAIGEQLKTAIPGLRQDVPAAQDVLGRPAPNPQQGFGAFIPRTTSERNDPLIQAFQDARVDIGAPPPDVSGVALSPSEQRRYQELSGQMLEQIATSVVSDPGWKDIPLVARQKILSSFQDTAHKVAEARIKGEAPDYGQRYSDATVRKAQGLPALPYGQQPAAVP